MSRWPKGLRYSRARSHEIFRTMKYSALNGWRRLWIVISITWLLFVGGVGWLTTPTSVDPAYMDVALEFGGEFERTGPPPLQGWLLGTLLFGGVPVVLLYVAGVAVAWIRDGFRTI